MNRRPLVEAREGGLNVNFWVVASTAALVRFRPLSVTLTQEPRHQLPIGSYLSSARTALVQ